MPAVPSLTKSALEVLVRVGPTEACLELGQNVILCEERPDWRDPDQIMQRPFAKLRCVRTTGYWTLYWMRADLKWHACRPAAPPRRPRVLD